MTRRAPAPVAPDRATPHQVVEAWQMTPRASTPVAPDAATPHHVVETPR
jgi:hypothetical protein